MSIGLDFVKEIDKKWEKHIQSLDRIKDDDIEVESNSSIADIHEDERSLNIEEEKSDWDYWSYWKKKYSVLR